MTKQKQELTVQEELREKIKQNSGEGEMPTFDFTPVITVDNSSEEKEVEGEKVDIRCKPRFSIQTGIEKEQSEIIGDSFIGIILKVKYFVTKKYEPTPSIPFFFSQEFDSSIFTNKEEFVIKHKVENGEDEIESINYPTFKEKYAGMYKLNAVLYVLKDIQLVKVRLKGAAMSVLWAYLKQFKGKDSSVSYQATKFIAIRKKEPQPYNALKLEVDKNLNINLETVLEKQEMLLSREKTTKAISGEVVAGDDIKVDDVPFN